MYFTYCRICHGISYGMDNFLYSPSTYFSKNINCLQQFFRDLYILYFILFILFYTYFILHIIYTYFIKSTERINSIDYSVKLRSFIVDPSKERNFRWNHCIAMFEGRDVNFGAMVNGYSTMTILPLIRYFIFATSA